MSLQLFLLIIYVISIAKIGIMVLMAPYYISEQISNTYGFCRKESLWNGSRFVGFVDYIPSERRRIYFIKKVLVDGLTGYLGRFVVKEFKKSDYQVRALARSAEKIDRVRKWVSFVTK